MFLLSVSLSYAPATAVPPPSAVVEHPRPRSVVGAAAAAIVVEEGRRTSDDLGLLKRTLKTSPAHNGQALDGWSAKIATRPTREKQKRRKKNSTELIDRYITDGICTKTYIMRIIKAFI